MVEVVVVVALGPSLHQRVVGRDPSPRGAEGGGGEPHRAGAAAVEAVLVHLGGGRRQAAGSLGAGSRSINWSCSLLTLMKNL